MTGISSHVFKRLVIVSFQSGSLTLAGWTTTRVSEYNRVGEFKRDGLLHDSGGISSQFKRLVIVIFQSGSLTLAGWTTTRVSEYNRVGEFKRDGLLHDSV